MTRPPSLGVVSLLMAMSLAALPEELHPSLPDARRPKDRDTRTPDDIAEREAKQAAKLARRAARATPTGETK